MDIAMKYHEKDIEKVVLVIVRSCTFLDRLFTKLYLLESNAKTFCACDNILKLLKNNNCARAK